MPLHAAGVAGGLPFDITQLLQFGLLGLIFLCLVFRKFVVPEWTLKQAEERLAEERERTAREREDLKAQFSAERADLTRRLAETRDQLAQLQGTFEDQMIPALTRSTEVNARYVEEMAIARYSAGERR